MRVGESHPVEIRHRVGFDPNDVVENPKSKILHDCGDTVDIVIRPDDPDRARILEHALTSRQPLTRELIVLCETAELVPAVGHRVHFGLVGTIKILRELQVVRRIGEN